MTVHCFEMMLQNEGSHSIRDGWIESIVHDGVFSSISLSAFGALCLPLKNLFPYHLSTASFHIVHVIMTHYLVMFITTRNKKENKRVQEKKPAAAAAVEERRRRRFMFNRQIFAEILSVLTTNRIHAGSHG